MDSDRIRFRLYLFFFLALLFLGIAGFMSIEGLSLVDALYFTIVTMATVGYGDIHPQSLAGKILAVILIIGGVGTFLGVVASITDIFVKRREEQYRRQKLNMVAGLFFSELGNGLLRQFARLDPSNRELLDLLNITNEWAERDFKQVLNKLKKRHFLLESRRGDLPALREYLQTRATFLLRMLENPALQEHGNFPDLLRATFHLRDELLNRPDLSDLQEPDRRHLEGDMIRVYRLLAIEWLTHMQYLKDHYGYLLSLAMRVNPFNPEANATVRDA